MGRNEHDRDVTLSGHQSALQLQSTHARHAHIKNEARGVLDLIELQKLLSRGERLRPEPD